MLTAGVIVPVICGIGYAVISFVYYSWCKRGVFGRSYLFFAISYAVISVLYFALAALRLTGTV